MSKNRLKLTKPVIRSRAEMELLIGEIRDLKIKEQAALARRESDRKQVDVIYAPVLEPIAKSLEEKTEVARAWAEANASEFNGLKSLEMTHGTVGWRTGKHTLKTITGWTFDRVLEKIKETGKHFAALYVRTKEEVNKQAIIEDREILTEQNLRELGLKIVQEESFYVEPKLTEVETRETADAR